MELKDLVDARRLALLSEIVIVDNKIRKNYVPDPYIDSLQRELAGICGSIIPIEDLMYIGKEDVDRLYIIFRKYAETSGIKLANPDYPDLIKVDFPDTFLKLNDKILDFGITEGMQVKTIEEYCTWIKEKSPSERLNLEYAVLHDNEKDALSKYLYRIYVVNSKEKGKLSISRKDRKEILKSINRMGLRSDEVNNKVDLILWKKLGKVLHPGEYATDFPSAVNFFQELRDKKIKIPHPDHPEKLHNLLWKAWKKGKEDMALENYMSQNTRVLDILSTLKYYYLRPGISRYKKINDLELGEKEPEELEKEMVEIVRMELRKKILDSISTYSKDPKYIPGEWKNIAAWELLCPRVKIKVPESFYISGDNSKTKILLRTVRPETNSLGDAINMTERGKYEKILYFLVPKGSRIMNDLKKGIHQNISVEDENHNTIWTKKIDTEANSILAFVYYPSEHILEWFGENTKQIYSGSPGKISDKREFDLLLTRPNPSDDIHFLSLYTLAEKLFIPGGTEKLTMEDLLCALKY